MILGEERSYIYYGERKIKYHIIRKNVKNINLSVKPNLQVRVSANPSVPLECIREFVASKAQWIEGHLRKYEKTQHFRQEDKQYVTGELFRYLGKEYSLKVLASSTEGVKILDKHIHLYIGDTENFNKKKARMQTWYKKRSQEFLQDSLEDMHPLVKEFTPDLPQLKIRKMKARWGTCYTQSNKIILNRALIKAPKPCMDYVVLHELIHFKHRKHNKDFYNMLDTLMPDWREKKKILEEVIVQEL